mmetsp:Transcript_18266/g.45665  ORF Transcript_18266/g.45665 Transcript_18266/m.45665 type:complete len:224 (-) Transcript_18266:4008-4679(-)
MSSGAVGATSRGLITGFSETSTALPLPMPSNPLCKYDRLSCCRFSLPGRLLMIGASVTDARRLSTLMPGVSCANALVLLLLFLFPAALLPPATAKARPPLTGGVPPSRADIRDARFARSASIRLLRRSSGFSARPEDLLLLRAEACLRSADGRPSAKEIGEGSRSGAVIARLPVELTLLRRCASWMAWLAPSPSASGVFWLERPVLFRLDRFPATATSITALC